MSKIALALVSIVVLAIVLFAGILFKHQDNIQDNYSKDGLKPPTVALGDHKNLTYIIENQPVKLVDGYSQIEAAPESASKITTRYFGNESIGDLNGDSRPDIVFLLTQETGGSGIFYYVAGALNTDQGYTPTNTIFLGDRIAPQTTQIKDGMVIVNFAERKLTEAMTARPSIGVSKYFKILNDILVGQDAPLVLGNCYIGGCSSEICSDQQGVASNCMYQEEYACYKTAICTRQTNNLCGWTQTPELTACLDKN